jgi:hypothetical protein
VIPLHGCEERHKKNTPNCVVRNTTNAKTDNHQLKRIWDMGNKQQTAVDYIFSQLPAEYGTTRSAFDVYQQAKEIEKEQIVDAYDYGSLRSGCEEGEQYYNETYGDDKQ